MKILAIGTVQSTYTHAVLACTHRHARSFACSSILTAKMNTQLRQKLQAEEDTSAEQKTWQVCCFGKRKSWGLIWRNPERVSVGEEGEDSMYRAWRWKRLFGRGKKMGWVSGPACCWHSFSSPVHPGSFFQQLSAQTLLHCSYHHLVQLHALTSVCVLKILNIGSHTIVRTHADTAYCRSAHEGRMCLCRWQELKTAI